jgi:hypothetical protein
MSRDTDRNLLIVSSMPRFYQQLLRGPANYETLGTRIINRIKTAHAFRQVERVRELSGLLINLPIREYRVIGQYYLAWCACRELRFNPASLERIFEQTQTYKIQALFSRGAIDWHLGNNEQAMYFYLEALKTSPGPSQYVDLMRAIAVLKAQEGFHASALRDLEKLIPPMRHAEPRPYYDFLNSYAVELGGAGRTQEARNICRLVLASPFIHAYPEWQETAQGLRGPDHSFAAVPSIERKRAGVETIEARKADEPERPATVVSFPPLKEARDPKRPEPVNPQELGDMTLADKKEFILKAVRAELLPENEYNKFIVMLGLARGATSKHVINLEDEEVLSELIVNWAHLIEPDQLAGVLSALRNCKDSARRNKIMDNMIRKAFEHSRTCNITESEWRLKYERRLPKN